MIKEKLETKTTKKFEESENESDQIKKKYGLLRMPCCLIILILIGGSLCLAWYLFKNIKDPLYQEIEERKDLILQTPQKVIKTGETVKEKIDEGIEFFEKAQKEIKNINEKVNEVKDITSDIKQTINTYTQE